MAACAVALATGCTTGAAAARSSDAVVAEAPRPERWHDPAYFSARVHQRVAMIESRVRADVSAGRLEPRAAGDAAARRRQVEAALAQACMDGYVGPRERIGVRAMVREMAAAPRRFGVAGAATGATPAARGGGPRATPGQRSYPDADGDWDY